MICPYLWVPTVHAVHLVELIVVPLLLDTQVGSWQLPHSTDSNTHTIPQLTASSPHWQQHSHYTAADSLLAYSTDSNTHTIQQLTASSQYWQQHSYYTAADIFLTALTATLTLYSSWQLPHRTDSNTHTIPQQPASSQHWQQHSHYTAAASFRTSLSNADTAAIADSLRHLQQQWYHSNHTIQRLTALTA